MEEEKSYHKIILGIMVISLLIVGGTYLATRDSNEGDSGGFTIDDEGDVQLQDQQKVIIAKHQFRDGTHIVAGEVELPTPCHILDNGVIVSEPIPQVVTIAFSAETTAEACTQVITPARFKVMFEADEKAKIGALYNGVPASLNLIEAGINEDLESFELFIKG